MRNSRMLLLIALALLGFLAGCFPPTSLRSFHLDDQVFFDESLLGAWASSDSTSMYWVFERHGEDAYTMMVPLDDDPDDPKLHSIGHLFRLGDATLLNVEPNWGALTRSLSPYPVLRGHTLLLLEWGAKSLKIGILDIDWWKNRLKRNPRSLPHEWIEPYGEDTEESLVLTATTKELQTFLRKELRVGRAFKDGWELRRVGK